MKQFTEFYKAKPRHAHSVYINCRTSDSIRPKPAVDRSFSLLSGTYVRSCARATLQSSRACAKHAARAAWVWSAKPRGVLLPSTQRDITMLRWKPPAFSASSSSDDSSSSAQKRRSITASTVERWKFENDRELQTSLWLKYEMADRVHVSTLSCSVCTQFQSKLKGMRNYNPAYIEGSNNLRASSFKDHTASDMHSRAMLMLKRAQSTDIPEYAPIARALHTMDSPVEQELKRKFDIAFMIAPFVVALYHYFRAFSALFSWLLYCSLTEK